MESEPAGMAGTITEKIREFARENPQNRMSTDESLYIFDEPLVQFASGDDPLFTELKTIIDDIHLTPREALALAGDKQPCEITGNVSVISWILPITETTRESNRSQTKLPSRYWSHTRWFGEFFNNAMRKHVTDFLTGQGYRATAPMTAPYFKIGSKDNGPFSNWSERHVAYAAGLGTFSLSDGFITEKGIAHRCGSVITDMELPASPRTVEGPFTNYLFYAEDRCGTCITRCPAGAISEKGHDKIKCSGYLHDIGYNPEQFRKGYDMEKSVAGCGLCQTNVPCEECNPTK